MRKLISILGTILLSASVAMAAVEFDFIKPSDQTSAGTISTDNSVDLVGDVSANSFSGDGTLLTGVAAADSDAVGADAVVNEAGGISKGQCVYVSGATGQKPQVSLCDNSDAAKHEFYGLAAEAKANSQAIRIITRGELTAVDTDGTGAPGTSESWSDGDKLYMSTSGNLTNVAPIGYLAHIGVVSYSHNSNGKIGIGLHNETFMATAADESLVLRMGDSSGNTGTHFKDYSDVIVASVTSDGKGVFPTVDVDTPTLNGVTYNFPVADGAGSTFLGTDGGGNLTWSTPAGAGDSVKAATESFTGAKTFESSATFNDLVTVTDVMVIGATDPIGLAEQNSSYIQNHWQVVAATITTANVVASVTFTGLEPEYRYQLIATGHTDVDGDSNFRMRVNADSGSNYKYSLVSLAITGPGDQASNSATYLPLQFTAATEVDAGTPYTTWIDFGTVKGGDVKRVNQKFTTAYRNTSGNFAYASGTGEYIGASDFTSIVIYTDTASRELGQLNIKLLKLFQ